MSRVMFTQGCGAPGGGWLRVHGRAASLGTGARTVAGAVEAAGVEGAGVAAGAGAGADAMGADEAAGAAALALGRLDHIWSIFL